MLRGVASLLVSSLGLFLPVLAAALSLALAGARGAAAQSADDERARAHFVAAQEYFEQGRFSVAASEFDEAYKLSGRPEMLINRARAEARAGELERAIASLELLFERHPQTSYRADAEKELALLRAERERRASAAPAAPPAAASANAGLRATATPPRDVKVWPPRLPTLIVGGALVASVLVSIGTGWAAHAQYNDLDHRCPESECAEDPHDDRARGQRLARTSTGFTFAALALAAATSVLWVYDVKARKKQISLGVSPAPTALAAQARWVY